MILRDLTNLGSYFDTVTVVIAIIGVLIPTLYAAFVYYLLKRHKDSKGEKATEQRSFLTQLQRERAVDVIEKRKQVSAQH